jgi:hypothetical protein
MPTALDAPDHMLDRQERNFVDQVRQHGWFDTNVFGEDESPGFSYTTGFWLRAKAPEIIVFSLRPEIAHDSLWHLYRAITAGTSFPIGLRRSGVFENVDAVSYQLPENSIAITLAGAAGSMAATTGLVQMVYPDANGLFPWDSGCDERVARSQPNLTGEAWPADVPARQ